MPTLQDRQPATSAQVDQLVQLGHPHHQVLNLTGLQARTLIAKGAVGPLGPKPYAWKKNPASAKP